ncbi:MAG: response regulator [Clostridia bacterium]|nr:response regulator [Clostridia bacterium]
MVKYEEIIKNINILLADDDEDYMMMTYAFLKQLGYNVDKAYDGKKALEMLQTNKYQITLLDYFMPELNGEEVVNKIRETNKEIIIILQTGFSGQKPPIDTMQKLNIQNYHDKTEGIDRLNLELISAVKIFNQQSEIELTKYKTKAIGELIYGVAQEIKSNLLSVGASMEYTNMLIQNNGKEIDNDKIEKLNKFYTNNKESLLRVDKVLSSIINQSTENTDYVMTDKDVMEIISLILKNEAQVRGIELVSRISLKSDSYIKGGINDTIFIVCEIIKELMELEAKGNKIELVLTEDEEYWYFNITNGKVSAISPSQYYILNKVVISIEGTNIYRDDNKIVISIKK